MTGEDELIKIVNYLYCVQWEVSIFGWNCRTKLIWFETKLELSKKVVSLKLLSEPCYSHVMLTWYLFPFFFKWYFDLSVLTFVHFILLIALYANNSYTMAYLSIISLRCSQMDTVWCLKVLPLPIFCLTLANRSITKLQRFMEDLLKILVRFVI